MDSLGVFIALRSSRSRRLLRGGAYTDCVERWSPGILSRSLPRKVGGRGATETAWCVGVCGPPAVGVCRPLGLGCGRCRAPPRDSDAHHPHARRGSVSPQHTHTESALHSSALTRATHTCYATAASLAHNPRRYVLCGTRDAERRVAQRSAAQHSTCKQHMHDRDTVHAHAHVSCTVVPSCSASTFHRPPTLFRGFGAQSLLCAVSVHSSRCGRRRAPPRDSDAHHPHARKGSVSPHAPQHTHTHRERVALERTHARHAHVLRNRTRSLLGSQSKEVCE